MKKTIISTVMLLGALSLSAQTANQPAAAADPVIIKAGSTEIRQSEFEAAVNALPDEHKQYVNGPGKRQFAENYLRLKMLAAEGAKAGLDKEAKVKSMLEFLRAEALAQAQVEKMQEKIVVTDAELTAAYDEVKERLDRARASHILIAFEGSPAAPAEGALSEDAAKAKAEEIRAKIAAGGDFAEIAKAESHDEGSGARGGELGEFGRGQMVPEFESAVFSSEKGTLTPVVRTQFGYHVIRVDDRSTIALDQVKGELEKQVRQQKLSEMIEKMQADSPATFSEEYFGAAAPATPAAPPAG